MQHSYLVWLRQLAESSSIAMQVSKQARIDRPTYWSKNSSQDLLRIGKYYLVYFLSLMRLHNISMNFRYLFFKQNKYDTVAIVNIDVMFQSYWHCIRVELFTIFTDTQILLPASRSRFGKFCYTRIIIE